MMKTNYLDENSDTRAEQIGKGREYSSNASRTVIRNKADEVAMLGHAGPFSQFIHSGLCPQTIKYGMK